VDWNSSRGVVVANVNLSLRQKSQWFRRRLREVAQPLHKEAIRAENIFRRPQTIKLSPYEDASALYLQHLKTIVKYINQSYMMLLEF
jgi:hypothetical protein